MLELLVSFILLPSLPSSFSLYHSLSISPSPFCSRSVSLSLSFSQVAHLPLIPLREVNHAVLARLRVGQSVEFLTQGFIKTVAPASELAFARMRPLTYDYAAAAAAAQQLRLQQKQQQQEQQKKKKKKSARGGASSLAAEFEAEAEVELEIEAGSSEDPSSLLSLFDPAGGMVPTHAQAERFLGYRALKSERERGGEAVNCSCESECVPASSASVFRTHFVPSSIDLLMCCSCSLCSLSLSLSLALYMYISITKYLFIRTAAAPPPCATSRSRT